MKKLLLTCAFLAMIITGCSSYTTSFSNQSSFESSSSQVEYSSEETSSSFSSSFESSSSGENSSSSNSSSSGSSSSSSSSIHIHSYSEEVIAPTCLEDGYSIYTCTCGDNYIDNITHALDHNYEVKETIASTFEENGKVIYECTRCQDTYFEEIDKLEHHYSNIWGHDTRGHFHSCVDTNYEDLRIDEEEHIFDVQEEEFSTTYTCLVCGYTYTDYVMMPETEVRYELICKTCAAADGDEIIFNDDKDIVYTLTKTENGWYITNADGQKLSIDEECNLVLDGKNNLWKISNLLSSGTIIANTIKLNNKTVYLVCENGQLTVKTGSSAGRPKVYKKVTVDLIYPISLEISGKDQVSLTKKTALDVSYQPSNTNTSNELIWFSSDESVATVENGVVKTVGVGTATITAKLITADEEYHAKYIYGSFNIEVIEQLKDTWTIMMYICGADLESDNGFATSDITEILGVPNQPDDVNIIIETGGAKSWKKYNISSKYLSRYHVCDNQLVLDTQLANASMGKQSTLESFLNWGLQTYPAENTGVIFWNHGGALDGVCFDEKYSNDSLTNSETAAAFKNVFEQNGLTDKLDFVGYDACLMQIQDVAEFNSQYFKYMVGSEEAEAGEGWVYNKWLDDVYADHDLDTIFKENCNSFVSAYGGDQTLSYLDLTQMNDYYTKFESLAQDIYSTVKSNYSSFKNIIKNTKDFGDIDYYYYSYNGLDTYGTIDGKDFLNKLGNSSLFTNFTDKINEVKEAYNKVVKYSKKGSGARNANGLAIIAAISISYPANQTSFTNWKSLFN